MKKLLSSLSLAISVVAFSVPAYSMTITPFDTADNLAQALVGSGVTVTDATYSGATAASGYFTGGVAAGIGIESGIVLTSGLASNLNGTENTSDSITGNNGVSGTSYLNALIPGYTTYDASVLEFDFTSEGDTAFFSYSFGSDEYNEYVDSNYNDVFGFFLDGTAVTDNVALLPDGTAVSINNVNNGKNSAFYNDNDPSNGIPTPFAFEYDGFTDVLVATLGGLTSGQKYHLTLAIADAGDYVLDSGVFLKAGSFGDTNPEIPEPSTVLMGAGLLGLAAHRRRRQSNKG